MPSSKICATNYEACITQAVDFVRHHSLTSEVLVVGATTEAANEVIRRACESALIGVHAITLRNLARVLAESRLHARGLTEITGIAREAVVTKVAGEAKLDYFKPVSRLPGFPKALSRTIRELRMEDAHPEGDLATLLDAYKHELRDRSLADVATVFATAAQVIHDRAHALCGLPVVLLDVPANHALERGLVDALTAVASDVLQFELAPEFKPSDVSIFSASSEALECVEIARRAGQLAEEGVPFDRMGVLARDAARLQPLLEEAFERARIPVWFANGCVRPSSSGRALLALLHCAREGLTATRFLEYLSLGQARGARSPRWERMIVNAAVVGGIDRWRRRLESLAWEGDAEFSKRADALAPIALPILETIAALPQRATWAEWLEHLAALADKAIYDRRPLLEFFEQLEPLSGIGSHTVALQDVIDLLADHLRNLREKPDGPRYGRVFAGSIDDARGMAFDTVFLPGLCEGSFPKLLREDPLLLNKDRARLSMTVADETVERRLLHQAAACARERFIVSYPRIDLGTGRARVPSLYAYDVLHAGIGAAFDPRELQQRAEANAYTTLAWPAPAEYRRAIDDTEYDLAVLREPFEAVPVPGGTAAYLDKVNSLAVHVLRNRWQRWHTAWHSTDGIFEDIGAQINLKQNRLSTHAYSATALQQFAVCPYRFYLSSILKLKPLSQPVAAQRMDPRTRGTIFHRTQAAVLRQLHFPFDLAESFALLEKTLDHIAEEAVEENPPAIPQVWAEEIARLRADLRGWLSELSRHAHEWTPAAVELSFGRDPDKEYDPKSITNPVKILDEFLLSGSIDVVEQNVSGVLRVLDHKTGTPPRDAPYTIGNGEVLQPILYALAAEQVLGKAVPNGRLFYATLRGNYRAVDVPVNDVGRQRMRGLLTVIDEAIDNGQFHTHPRKDACGTCDYYAVCGPYEEERAGRKARVPRLEEIRRTR
jgi:RecB family exonuclease